MRKMLVVIIMGLLVSCKNSKASCEAYSQTTKKNINIRYYGSEFKG